MDTLFHSGTDIIVTHRQDPVQGYMAPSVQERSPHFHYQYEMLVVVAGSADFNISGNIYHVEKGSILCISNMENHYVMEYNKGFERYSIRFSSEALSSFVHGSQLLSLFKQRTAGFSHHYRCIPEEVIHYQRICGHMVTEFHVQKDCWDLRIGSMFQEILIHMYRTQKNSFPAYQHTDVQRLVFEIQNYIETHVQEDLSLQTIADKYYVNKFYLSHCFSDIAGHTFKQHVVLARISKAKDLLLTSDTEVSSICAAVGFNSVSHFVRIFKKYEHISPLQYRNRGKQHN